MKWDWVLDIGQLCMGHWALGDQVFVDFVNREW